MLDFNLTTEQRALQQRAREFAMQEILPVAWYYDRRDETPLTVLKKAYDAGFMNTDIPKQYGGKGYGLLEAAIMTEEFAAACPGLATSIFDNSLGMEPLLLSNNDPLKEEMFPAIAGSFKLICFGTSEPTTGSDVSGIRCRAEPDGDDFILNGTKYWITNGGIADYMSVFATTDPKALHDGIGAFLVNLDWDGVTVGRPIPKMGQRCSNTVGIRFNNVRVPKERVLAPPGEGFVLAMKTFSRTRPIIGAFATGTARSAMEYCIDYVKKRRAFGSKIGDYQAVQFKLAEMFQKVETSRLLTWKGAWEADNGMDPTVTASIAKFYTSEVAQEVLNEALQIFGGYGYTKMFPIEKLLRDARLLRIYEGTSEIQRMIVAGHVMAGYRPTVPPLEQLALHRETDPSAIRDADGIWRCRMCGYVHYGVAPPEHCPYCFFPPSAFSQIEND
jgi:acyl-CoA dehydrogenase